MVMVVSAPPTWRSSGTVRTATAQVSRTCEGRPGEGEALPEVGQWPREMWDGRDSGAMPRLRGCLCRACLTVAVALFGLMAVSQRAAAVSTGGTRAR
jgi:hypothetical protein